MSEARWTKQVRPATWLALLGIVVAIGCAGSARAAEDEQDDSFDSRIWRNMKEYLGGSDGGSIEYRERSPLVVPPSRDLPPPERGAAVKKNALPPDLGVSRQSDIIARRLSGSANRAATAAAPTDDRNEFKAQPMDLSKVFNGGGLGSVFGSSYNGVNEIGTFTSEPPRMSLTEPPPGYQTPSPAAPYGVTSGAKYDKPYVDAAEPLIKQKQ
jgi:hypothetical protein